MAIPLLVPQIANLQKGLHYDFVGDIESEYSNEAAQEPIEDPQRSYSSDHNRELPTIIRVNLEVAAYSVKGNPENDGPQRISSFIAALRNLRTQQAVSTDAYFDVFSGVTIHQNCRISRMAVKRTDDEISVAKISLTLVETRFSISPRLSPIKYLLEANDGPVGQTNGRLVSNSDRMITEGIMIRRSARISTADSMDIGPAIPFLGQI